MVFDGNSIIEKQNDEKMISLLKLQKYYYGQASRLSTVGFLLCVILPLFLGLINQFVLPETWHALINLSIGYLTISLIFLNNAVISKKEYAARVQNVFDCSIYDFSVDESSHELSEMYVKSKKKQVKKQDDVRNWYPEKLGSLDKNTAIFYCQLTNVKWGKELRRFYFYFVTAISGLMILAILITAIFTYTSIVESITYLAVMLPIIVYCIQFIVGFVVDNDRQRRLLNLCLKVHEIGKFSTDELLKIQRELFLFRMKVTKIPNWFFYVFRKRLQTEADDYADSVT